MRVSIVTISFNQAEYLKTCIESVLSQDYNDIQYIVVDPGSTDGSREIIKSYGNKISPIFENDSGPADGLNKGFAIASGELFAYINSDDVLLPNAISKAVSEINSSNSDVLHGNALIINENDSIVRKVYTDKFNLIRTAYGSCILIQPSSFFKKGAFLKAGGFNVNNRSNWDGELFIDLALSGSSFSRSGSFFSAYRVHSNSITGSGSLVQKHRLYSTKMYEKITGRPFESRSQLLEKYFYITRKVMNFRDTFERLRHGPVFASK